MGGLARRERRGFSAESAARRITSGDKQKISAVLPNLQYVSNINPSQRKYVEKLCSSCAFALSVP